MNNKNNKSIRISTFLKLPENLKQNKDISNRSVDLTGGTECIINQIIYFTMS